MFLEQHGLIKEARMVHTFSLNVHPAFAKMNKPEILMLEVQVLISDVVDVLLCVVSGSFMFRR